MKNTSIMKEESEIYKIKCARKIVVNAIIIENILNVCGTSYFIF